MTRIGSCQCHRRGRVPESRKGWHGRWRRSRWRRALGPQTSGVRRSRVRSPIPHATVRLPSPRQGVRHMRAGCSAPLISCVRQGPRLVRARRRRSRGQHHARYAKRPDEAPRSPPTQRKHGAFLEELAVEPGNFLRIAWAYPPSSIACQSCPTSGRNVVGSCSQRSSTSLNDFSGSKPTS